MDFQFGLVLSAAQSHVMCLQPEAAQLEGLAKNGSQACLMALRDCLPSRSRLPRSMSSLALVQPAAPAIAPGDAAAYQRMGALLEHTRSMPSAQGVRDPTGRQGSAGPAAVAVSEGVQPGWGALGRATSSSCSRGSALRVGNTAQHPAPGNTGPGERPQRPAWLEEAARRISQGIKLGTRVSHKGSSTPGVSFPESLPAAFAALGVAPRSAA